MGKKYYIILCLCLFFFSCQKKAQTTQPTPDYSKTSDKIGITTSDSSAYSKLTEEELKIANALGENGYYYYCAKHNSIIHASFQNGKISYKQYSCSVSQSNWTESIDPYYYEIKDNKVVSIIYEDTKIILTDIKEQNQITDYLINATKEKLRNICGDYRDDRNKQNISFSESNGQFLLKIQKDDGTKIEDVISKFTIDSTNRIRSQFYSLYFWDSDIGLENYKEPDSFEFIFKVLSEKASYFIKPSKITATSTLVENNKEIVFYSADNLTDNTWKSWCEGKNDDGIGEKLTFEFDKPVPIEKICIRNGYGDLRYYYTNNRIKTISVYINGNKINDFTLIDKFNCQDLSIGKNNVTKIEIEIKEVYPGTKHKDTCISEIYFIRELSVFSYDFPEFQYDDLTTESLAKFPHQEIIYPFELPDTLFYSEKGNPIMLYLSNPEYDWHDERFINLDFYLYDIKNRVWKTDNDNPIFADIKAKSDLAKQHNKRMKFYIDSFSDIMFIISEVGAFNFDGVKFFEPEKEPEPEYTGNER